MCSISAMVSAVSKKSDLRPTGIHDIGYHYSRTLQEWRMQFLAREEEIKNSAMMIPSAGRIYYLCYCEAGFEEGYAGIFTCSGQTERHRWKRIPPMNTRMKFLLNLVVFQAAWFACVLGSKSSYPMLYPVLGFVRYLG